MSVGLESLMKTLPGLLRANGIAVSFQETEPAREPVQGMIDAASLPEAKMLVLQGQLKDGSSFTGIMVLNKPPAKILPAGT